jgi:hypothetical protein
MRKRTLAAIAATWLVCGLSNAAEPSAAAAGASAADLAVRAKLQQRVDEIAADSETYRRGNLGSDPFSGTGLLGLLS